MDLTPRVTHGGLFLPWPDYGQLCTLSGTKTMFRVCKVTPKICRVCSLIRNYPAYIPAINIKSNPFQFTLYHPSQFNPVKYFSSESPSNSGSSVDPPHRTEEASGSEDESHEEDHQERESEKSESEIRTEILNNALNYVNEHGWSRRSLGLGAEDVGYSQVVEGMFARGGADLVLHFVRKNNQELVEYMQTEISKEEQQPKTSEFMRNVLEYRLRMIIPYIEVWSDAMALLLQPNVIVDATSELQSMVDDIWHYAGDKSVDFNWYTKRVILAKVFVSTQAVMINDQSPDFKDSWNFLDRRLSDVATFGKVSSIIRKQTKTASDVLFAGYTVLRNVAGFGETRR